MMNPITLDGSEVIGTDGKTIKSMSLSEAYAKVVLPRLPGESRWPKEPVKTVPAEPAKTSITR